MPKKNRKKKASSTPEAPPTNVVPRSSRFQFFLWMCSFFFFAALVMRTDDFTVWPGAEGYALDHALSRDRGGSMLSFLYHLLFPVGAGIDEARVTMQWLFPRLLSSLALIAAGISTYKLAGKLFGKEAIGYGLLCAGASLFLPFFGKVATPDAVALLGQAGFFWTILLAGADKEKNYLLPAGIFLLLAGIAAPVSTLIFGLATILAARFLMGGSKQWMTLLTLLAFPLVVLLLQGNQGIRSYWFWGGQPLAYGKWLGLSLLGMAPLSGWLLGGVRDLVYKAKAGEATARLYAAGLGIGFVTQSLVFPLILALLAGKQMQLYFAADNYPWRDWVRSGATVHLVIAFLAAVLALAGIGIAFPGPGFRAALGMAAAYWMFSLFGVLGLYGERRDFALGGSVLAGMLGVLFFWVQVYPYFEAKRSWPERLANQVDVKLPVYVPASDQNAVALPYFRLADIPVTKDSTEADLRLISWPTSDTLTTAGIEVEGRELLELRTFGLKTE